MSKNTIFVHPPAWPEKVLHAPLRLELKLPDGYVTPVFWHRAQGHRRGLPVLYVHGIQSHPGWFAASASAVAEAGHDVFQVTRRGSGLNTADRGHARSAGVLVEDVAAACEMVMSAGQASQVHLAGVSWGGKLLACYCSFKSRPEVASLTLVAPGIVPRVDVAIGIKLAVLGAAMFRPRAMFDIPLSDVELFTDTPVMRQYLRDEPLRLHKATAGFLLASAILDRRLKNAKSGSLNVPTTLLLACRDRIIDNAKTAEVLQKLAGDRLRTVEFDAAHTIEFEADLTPLNAALVEAFGKR